MAAWTLTPLLHAQETWTPSAAPAAQNLWSVAYGGGAFVAVGEGSTVISSPDGSSWVQRSVPVSSYWLVAVAHGGGTWVIVGDKGLIVTSSDLITWTVRASGTQSRINGVAYGGGRWIAVAESGELLTSTDAIAWTKLKPSADRLRGIAYAYGQFVITGDNGLIRATIDATDYAERVLPGSFFVEAVIYAKRNFVAVGESGFAVKSTDGVTWDRLDSSTTAYLRGVAFFNNQFIACGTDGTILTTDNLGSPWRPRNSGTGALLTSVAASETCAVAVGFGGAILRSLPAVASPAVSLTPPVLTEAFGSNVLLQPVVSGSPPLSYQWFFNGVPIAGATSERLFLSGVQAAQAGNYSLRVTNPYGSATSSSTSLGLVTSVASSSIVDTSFAPGISMPNGVAAAVEQSDGKIVIGGSGFFVPQGIYRFALARLNRDGSLDNSFPSGSGFNPDATVSQLLQQADGKIVVVGSFLTVNGISRPKMVRLDSSGSVDLAFVPAATIAATQPRLVALQRGTNVIALVDTRLVRLNSDGSLDTAFESATGGLSVNSFGVFADGSVAVALGGVVRNGVTGTLIQRLSAAGAALTDLAFVPGQEPRYGVSLASTPDGRVFLTTTTDWGTSSSSSHQQLFVNSSPLYLCTTDSGWYRMIGFSWTKETALFPSRADALYLVTFVKGQGLLSTPGPGRTTILRQGLSGLQDTSFDSRKGANGEVTGLFPLNDGGVLVTGQFTAFDEIALPNLVRLFARNAFVATPPTIVSVEPEVVAVPPGREITLTGLVAGTAPLSYEWTVTASAGSEVLPTTSDPTLPTFRMLPFYPGTFTVRLAASNRLGTVTSIPIRIVVADSAPIIISEPSAATTFSGKSATLSVAAAGTLPMTYQWFRGTTPAGSGSTLSIAQASSANQGEYTVVISNSVGKTTSRTVRLTVDSAARLVNLSTRAELDRGAAPRTLIAGFVIRDGSGLRVLARGVGPSLSAFGLAGAISDPMLSIVDSSQRAIGENDDFGSATPGGSVPGVGAFLLKSSEAAWTASLAPGGYTVQLLSKSGSSGIGLVELYRADDSPSRLINLSSRCWVGTGSSVAIAGIALEGELPRQFLIRAVGPGLKEFGVSDAVSDPVLNLTSPTGVSLFQNDNWVSAPNVTDLTRASTSVGAFPLLSGSRDSAMLVTLSPGNYTAVVSGAGGGTGTVLIEIYEVP